eukprot:GHVR01096469.1.p1 GENE.GHVR01096469.1~~GHVR01096469.1.p1  ORF type:complete len:191 (-),score=59.31 GHVR01096469.1:800-1339(-)
MTDSGIRSIYTGSVSTPYGIGVVVSFKAERAIYEIRYPYGIGYHHERTVAPCVLKKEHYNNSILPPYSIIKKDNISPAGSTPMSPKVQTPKSSQRLKLAPPLYKGVHTPGLGNLGPYNPSQIQPKHTLAVGVSMPVPLEQQQQQKINNVPNNNNNIPNNNNNIPNNNNTPPITTTQSNN